MHGEEQEKESNESYSSRFHSVLKRLAVGTSVAGIAAACAIIVLSLKGGDRELPRSDGSRSEEKRIICERASGDGLQDAVATNALSTTGRPPNEPTLLELERLGRVPEGATERTWRLCEKTSWWGRRLDPEAFWSNRVVWLSWESENEANRHGRRYPPIPIGNSMFLDRNDTDAVNPLTTREFRDRAYSSSNRERVYWNWREFNCPLPPEKIQSGLVKASSEWKAKQNRSVFQPNGMRMPPTTMQELFSGLVDRFKGMGFPKEALSQEVLDWEYVRCKRVEWETIVREPNESVRIKLLKLFNRSLACSESLVVSDPSDEEIRVTVAGSVIDRCRASGNGGGAYVTIRGLLRLFNTDIQNSVALNLGKSSQESFGRIEGMGGGIHISAGGITEIVGGGHVCITNNRAAENGGGISVKSGRLEVIGHLDIVENGFTNAPTAGNGNGGGLYVTTSYHDDGWPLGAGFRTAQLYDDDGTVASSQGMVRIAKNSATRWGGGVYVGLTPLLPYEIFHRDCHAFVSLTGATISENNAMQASKYESGLPSQVCLERFTGANPPLAGNGGCVILIDSSIVGNDQDDIGIYSLDAPSAITNGVQFLHVLHRTLVDYSE